MGKVGQFLLAGTMVSAVFSPVAIQVAKGETELKLAQAPAPPLTPEELRKRQQQQQQQPQRQPPPPPPARQPPPPPPPPPQATPPRVAPPQAPAQVQPPTRVPPQAPAQVQPPTRVPPTAAPAQIQPPTRVPPTTAPAQIQPPTRVPPTTAPAQIQPPTRVPPTTAPAQIQPPTRLPPTTAPAQIQPPTAPTQVAPVTPVTPLQRPALVAPPSLPAPTAAQARPLPAVSSGPAAILPTSPQGQPVRRLDQLRSERREVREGDRTIIRESDRVIVREANGRAFIRHSDVDRFRYGARDVRVEHRGRDNVTTVVLPNGQRVVTVLDADGRLMRRSRWVDGREIIIIDQRPVVAGYNYFVELPPPIIRIPRERYIVEAAVAPPALIYDTLMAPPVEPIDQPYSLDQIRYSYSLRERMPSVDIDTINFETGSWEVTPDQIERLASIADAIGRVVAANPREVFMIEGHTDAVGSDVDNLSLSDRRAETVALILSQQFNVPPENLVTQGYGEQYLKIPTDGPERRNRRVTARRITPLLGPQAGGQQ